MSPKLGPGLRSQAHARSTSRLSYELASSSWLHVFHDAHHRRALTPAEFLSGGPSRSFGQGMTNPTHQPGSLDSPPVHFHLSTFTAKDFRVQVKTSASRKLKASLRCIFFSSNRSELFFYLEVFVERSFCEQTNLMEIFFFRLLSP